MFVILKKLTYLTLYKIYKIISFVIAPPFCAYCKAWLQVRIPLCKKCTQNIMSIVSHTIQVTKKHPLAIFAVSNYKDPLKKLILAKAFSDIAVSKQLGQLLWEHTYIAKIKFDYIVPIPLHWQRYAKRGFNQAEEIANVIANKSGKPLLHAIKRVKKTVPQSQLHKDERVENVKGVFVLRSDVKEKLKGKTILLVDDLCTTGATLKSAARVLVDCKPKQLYAAVMCRVV